MPFNNYPPPPMNNYGPYVNPYPPPFPPTATVYTNYGVDDYYGIKGWLILPAIGVVANPLLLAFTTLQGLATYASLSGIERNIAQLPTGGIRSLLLMEIMVNALMLIFSISLAVQFFRKRKIVPTMFIAFLLATLIFAAIDCLVAQSALDSFGEAIRTRGAYSSAPNPLEGIHLESLRTVARAAVACLIWIPYFKVSKRVKATFVH